MKPEQLAKLLGVTSSAIRRWVGMEEYGKFLSPTGQGINGSRRIFNDQDARIIAWIAALKTQNMVRDEILEILSSAKNTNWKELPELPHGGSLPNEPIAVVPREAVQERVAGLAEKYEVQLAAITEERDRLRQELSTVQQSLEQVRLAAAEALRKQQSEASEVVADLQREIKELASREAELRGRLEQYSLGGKRLNATTLVIVALITGALFTLLLLFSVFLLNKTH